MEGDEKYVNFRENNFHIKWYAREANRDCIFLCVFFKKTVRKRKRAKSVDDILDSLIGIISDNGKTLEDYKDERIAEKYGINDWYQCYIGYHTEKK